MTGPLLDVAMSYVKLAAPHFDDEEGRQCIRDAFQAFIYAGAPRAQLISILDHYLGSMQPLERIDAILQAPEQPPPMPRADFISDSMNSIRKKTRPWATAEDVRLLAGIHRFGLDNWVSVAKFVGNGRSRAQCAQRWVRGLDPRISKDQWSPEDEEKLLSLIKNNANKGWTTIASGMGNRSDVQCRYHFLQMQRDGKLTGEYAGLMPTDKPHSPPIPLPSKVPTALPRMMTSKMQMAMAQMRPQRARSFSLQEYSGYQVPGPMQYPQMGYPGFQGYQMPMAPQMGYACASPPPTQLAQPVPTGGQRLSKQRKSASQVQLPYPRQLFGAHNVSDDPFGGGEGDDLFEINEPDLFQEEGMDGQGLFGQGGGGGGQVGDSNGLIDWTNDHNDGDGDGGFPSFDQVVW